MKKIYYHPKVKVLDIQQDRAVMDLASISNSTMDPNDMWVEKDHGWDDEDDNWRNK